MIIDLSKSRLSDVTLYDKQRTKEERLALDVYGLPYHISWNLDVLYDVICQLMHNTDITIYFTPEDMDYIIDADQHWFWEKLKNSVEMIAKK